MEEKELKIQIITAMKSFKKKRIRRHTLFSLLKLDDLRYEDFKNTLDELVLSGEIICRKGRRFELPDDAEIITGVFSASRKGSGFVDPEEGDSVFIGANRSGLAMTGDTVQAKVLQKQRDGKSKSGEIIKIVKRTTRPVLGIFKQFNNKTFIIPKEDTIHTKILVKNEGETDAVNGNLVVAQLELPVPGINKPMCVITEVLGDPDTQGMDVLVIAKKYQLPTTFNELTLKEAEEISPDLTPEIISQRTDIREHLTYTIDPDDAKDFDDAISISRSQNGGYEIGVHIADVSHYVKDESSLDSEAMIRGMSCYLVDRVIPMLPERLSNDLCSLKPKVDRLTKSVFALLDETGKVLSYSINNTVIRSRKRLTYQQVQTFLDKEAAGTGEDNRALGKPVGESLKVLSELTELLISNRAKRGALDFELPEAKVVLDEKGIAVDVIKRDRFEAHKMVEEAMLLANTVVAEALGKKKVPALYRVHEKPDKEKMLSFGEIANLLGYDFHITEADNPHYLREFLESLQGKTHERILNMLFLRSLKKARYTATNKGHFGLALPEYTHFTSPIRRYPDLIVHRQLDEFVIGDAKGKVDPEKGISYYETLGEVVTQREIVTVNAERDSVKMKMCELMQGHLGEEFEGTISGILPIGFFVELDEYFIEGLVHVSNLDDDYYEIDRTGMALAGRNRGQRYSIGDRLRVLVASADKDRGEVDFEVIKERPEKKNKKTVAKKKK